MFLQFPLVFRGYLMPMSRLRQIMMAKEAKVVGSLVNREQRYKKPHCRR
jgi:hypothetical protein